MPRAIICLGGVVCPSDKFDQRAPSFIPFLYAAVDFVPPAAQRLSKTCFDACHDIKEQIYASRLLTSDRCNGLQVRHRFRHRLWCRTQSRPKLASYPGASRPCRPACRRPQRHSRLCAPRQSLSCHRSNRSFLRPNRGTCFSAHVGPLGGQTRGPRNPGPFSSLQQRAAASWLR